MKTLTQLINESKSELKPIHLFKNDGTYCKESYFNSCIKSIEEDWPAATQDGHEDEVICMTNEHPDFNKFYDKYCINSNVTDGLQCMGIGLYDTGFIKYKTNTKYPIWYIYRGTNNRNKHNKVLIGDRHLFES